MRAVLVPLAVLLVVVAACPGPAPGEGEALTGAERDEMIAAHDAVRAAVDPPAPSPLPALSWNDDAAAYAADWARGCVFEHGSGNAFGENLAFFSGIEHTPSDVVDGWASEDADYDYEANTCAPGAMCGHYTQIVWAETTSIGCAKAECTIDGFEGLYWVCEYDPPGNFVGERPY